MCRSLFLIVFIFIFLLSCTESPNISTKNHLDEKVSISVNLVKQCDNSLNLYTAPSFTNSSYIVSNQFPCKETNAIVFENNHKAIKTFNLHSKWFFEGYDFNLKLIHDSVVTGSTDEYTVKEEGTYFNLIYGFYIDSLQRKLFVSHSHYSELYSKGQSAKELDAVPYLICLTDSINPSEEAVFFINANEFPLSVLEIVLDNIEKPVINDSTLQHNKMDSAYLKIANLSEGTHELRFVQKGNNADYGHIINFGKIVVSSKILPQKNRICLDDSNSINITKTIQ